MSQKERKRIPIMAGVKAKQLSLVQATELLEVSYRQAKRIWRRYQADGDAGLVHRLRGQPSHRRKPTTLRTQVLAFCRAERFADFGPTLLAEHLAKAKLVVDHETLRRWLLADGQRVQRRRQARHRQWRERKPCFGAMIQLDGSHHDWFEGRGPKCTAMVMVDDATNRLHVRFAPEETTRASYDVFEDWVRRHGLPASLYVDRDSIYRCEGQPTIAEQLAGKEPQTQFGRAMAALGVELILANSPQAKGRVERMNGLLQDRLVKELRLAGVSDIAGANRFLREKFLPAYHRRFPHPPASPVDVHRPAPKNLADVLSWEVERVVQADWTVACDGRRYQLDRQYAALSLVRRKVIVRTLRDGQVQLIHRGQRLKWRALPAAVGRPLPTAPKVPVKKPRRTTIVPAATHPWRRFGFGAGRNFPDRSPRAGGGPLPPVPPPARAQSHNNNRKPKTPKGTFSPEFNRGHF